MDIHVRILGNLLGYFTTEVGELKEVVHLWDFTVMMTIAVNAYISEWFDPKRRTFDEIAAHYTHILFDGYGYMDDPGAGKQPARTNRKVREPAARSKANQAILKRER